jgi:hypothetical protein
LTRASENRPLVARRRQNPSRIIGLGSSEVICRGEVVEVGNVDGVLHIARKVRYHDDQCLSAVNVNIGLFCAAAPNTTDAIRGFL